MLPSLVKVLLKLGEVYFFYGNVCDVFEVCCGVSDDIRNLCVAESERSGREFSVQIRIERRVVSARIGR